MMSRKKEVRVGHSKKLTWRGELVLSRAMHPADWGISISRVGTVPLLV